MTDQPHGGKLSIDDVRQWVAERKRYEARLEQIKRKLEAAEILFPGITLENVTETQSAAPQRRRRMPGGGFKQGIRKVIVEQGRALEPMEMRDALEGTEYRDTIMASPNYLYTTISRMVKRGELVREGSAYRLPDEATSVEEGDHSEEDDSGAGTPRLFNFKHSAEAVAPARKVGGT